MKTKKTLLLFTRKITAALLSLIVLMSALLLQPTSAAAQENARIIVSLGDSYSSGEGIEEFYDQNLPIEEKVKSRDWLAQRSTRSWPGMLTLSDVDGNMASHRGENWFFVAASGAETKHMTEKQEKIYSKQGHEGTTYLPPQLKVFEKLRGKKVDYVTLTLGGNDAKFIEIITKVFSGGWLNANALSGMLNNVQREFFKKSGIRDKLKDVYYAISKKAPDAAIIVAGYPKLLNPEGSNVFVSKEEAKLVNKSIGDFNDNVKALVKECRKEGLDIHFVSVEEGFSGHEAYTDKPYIYEILAKQSEDITDRSIARLDLISGYSMHPNIKGAKVYAKCVQKVIDKLEAKRAKEISANTAGESGEGGFNPIPITVFCFAVIAVGVGTVQYVEIGNKRRRRKAELEKEKKE